MLLEDHVALFPGQGSLGAQSGEAWKSNSAWDIVSEVSDITKTDVAALLLQMDSDQIVRTDRAQLGTFTLSLVGWATFCQQHSAPKFLAGHSLGELTALVAAEVLTLADGARLVAARGSAMLEASRSQPGTMVALMGGSDEASASLRTMMDLWIANVNGPGQIVMSGTREAVDDLVARSRELGRKRATALNVGGAFHCPLMSPAQEALDMALSLVTFSATEHQIVANVDGCLRGGGDEWRSLLSRQLTSPVQYLAMINSLPETVQHAVELPPAGVLAGLTKRIRPFESISILSGAPS